jgi:hypothetical protein
MWHIAGAGRRIRWARFFILFVCFGSFGCQQSVSVARADPTHVAFAGLAMADDIEGTGTRYPYTVKYRSAIDVALNAQLKNFTSPSLILHSLDIDDVGKLNLSKGYSIGMALVIDYENVSTRVISGHYQLVVDVAARLLFFDASPAKKLILGTHALPTTTYIDAFDSPPSPEQIDSVMAGFFLNGLTGESAAGKEVKIPSVVELAVSRLANINVTQSFNNRIGIGSVSVAPSVLESLPDHYQNDPQGFANYLGRQFSRFLGEYQQVSVLPMAIDDSLVQIARHFTGDGSNDVYTLPKADYLVDIDLTNLDYALADQNANAQALSFRSLATLKLRDVDNAVLFDHPVANYAGHEFLRTQSAAHPWLYLEQTLLVLFKEFNQQIAQQDRVWLKDHGLEAARKDFAAFADAVKLSR